MKFSTGTEVLDGLLEGGYSSGGITTIYGPAATGKTTACLLAAIACAKRGKMTVFIDTEGGFSVERLKQLTPDYENVLETIIIFRITSFEEQILKFRLLPELAANPKIGLVVVDTIGCHYRGARREEDYKPTNAELQLQVEALMALTKREELCVLMTNQVYADVEKIDEVVPVGGEIIRRRSVCLIEFKALHGSLRSATLLAHPELKEKKEQLFEIVGTGFSRYSLY